MSQEQIEINLRQKIPEDRPVVLVIRQGGKDKWDAKLLERLGAKLGNRLKFAASSTYEHCVVQASAIISAAGQPLSVITTDDLGDPGILVNKESLQTAESYWNDLGHDAITLKLMNGDQVPGFNDPSVSSHRLLCWMLEKSESAGTGVSLFISHDIVMLVIMARLFNMQLNQDRWPNRFEGIAFWRENDKVACSYQGSTSMASLMCSRA